MSTKREGSEQMNDNELWAKFWAYSIGAVTVVIVAGILRGTIVETTALNRGLCQGTVVGHSGKAWVPCHSFQR